MIAPILIKKKKTIFNYADLTHSQIILSLYILSYYVYYGWFCCL